jgi:hypothetical protein
LVVYAELHRQMLLVGGARVPVAAVQSINFVENAVSLTVPVVGIVGGWPTPSTSCGAVGPMRRWPRGRCWPRA